MASIANDPNGFKRLTYIDSDGRQCSIRLGKMNKHKAETIRTYVEDLIIAKESTTSITQGTALWLSTIGQDLHQKLVKKGLTKPREQSGTKLRDLLKNIFDTLNVGASTVAKYSQTRASLESFFGADRVLDTITAHDAEKWQAAQRERGLATATIAKNTVHCKMFFRKAVRWKLIAESPFLDIKPGSQVNKDRAAFISREDAYKVMDACPNDEWRLIFALSRFGGLRCPSEHLALSWSDVLWDKERIVVRSCKTKQYEGKETRIIPLFPELRPLLMRLFENAEPGAEYVITRYRQANSNLRTQLERIIARAGLKPWPRLFHNLRATRQTELVETHPAHVVSAWMGNSVAIATAHYLQVRDSDFDKAVTETRNHPVEGVPTPHYLRTFTAPTELSSGVTKSVTNASHNASLSTAASCGPLRPDLTKSTENKAQKPQGAGMGCSLQNASMPPEGLEPSTR